MKALHHYHWVVWSVSILLLRTQKTKSKDEFVPDKVSTWKVLCWTYTNGNLQNIQLLTISISFCRFLSLQTTPLQSSVPFKRILCFSWCLACLFCKLVFFFYSLLFFYYCIYFSFYFILFKSCIFLNHMAHRCVMAVYIFQQIYISPLYQCLYQSVRVFSRNFVP